MAVTMPTVARPGPSWVVPVVPALDNGDQVAAAEFLRRYEAMPQVKKAELIEGVVYMGSPVRLIHAEPDTLMQTWLGYYSAHTLGVVAATNATVRLDAKNVPQPDALLRLLPEYGGRTRVDAGGDLEGPPELVVEIAGTSASIDLRDKLKVYCRSGVREYLVWRTSDGHFDWFVLENQQYHPRPPAPDGFIESRIFPGLRLDVAALLAADAARVLRGLEAGLQSPAHTTFLAEIQNAARR